MTKYTYKEFEIPSGLPVPERIINEEKFILAESSKESISDYLDMIDSINNIGASACQAGEAFKSLILSIEKIPKDTEDVKGDKNGADIQAMTK